MAHHTNRPPTWLALVVITASVAALADWPYGYYQLLRIAVTGYAIWIAWWLSKADKENVMWIFIFIAVAFNPVIKISMERATHEILNIITAIAMAVEMFKNHSTKAPPPQP